MQTDCFITGKFIRELNNRFLCEVVVDNKTSVCYVPSSCHLSNFIDLTNRNVLLVKNKSKHSRTDLSLYGLPYRNSVILLNPSLANSIVEENIHRMKFAFLGKRTKIYREHTVNGYKSDLFIDDSQTVIEIKSLISTDNSPIFPTVFSERTLNQLRQIYTLLSSNSVYYFIISLNPYVKEIRIDESTEFYRLVKQCSEKGLKLLAFCVEYSNNSFRIKREIPILAN